MPLINNAQLRQGASSARSTIKGINEYHIGLGVFMIALGLTCTILQIQNTELYAGSGVIVTLQKPDPWVMAQIPMMVAGQMSATQIITIIAGWGTELAYLSTIIGAKQFNHAVGRHNMFLAGCCQVVAGVIVAFNGYCDFVYGQTVIHTFPLQISFAVVMTFIVSTFIIAGVHYVKIGLDPSKAVA